MFLEGFGVANRTILKDFGGFDARLITANIVECSWKKVVNNLKSFFSSHVKNHFVQNRNLLLVFLTSDCVGLPVFSVFKIMITNSPTKPFSPVFFELTR